MDVQQVASGEKHHRQNKRASIIRPAAPVALYIIGSLIALATLLPLAYLLIRAFEVGENIGPLLTRPRTLQVLLNSIALAAAVTLSTIGIALPVAWLIERTRLPAVRLWRLLTAVPLAVPSLVGAYSFIAAFGYGGLFHVWIKDRLGLAWADGIYGFTGSWIVLTLLTFPYVLLPISSTLRTMDGAQEEAARSLGHSSLGVFFKVILPGLSPAIMSGGLLVALYTLSDFAAVSLLQFDSFTRVIYVQYQASFNRNYAAILSLVLIMLAIVLLAVEGRVRSRSVYYRSGTGTRKRPRQMELGKWRWPALVFLTLLVLMSVGLPVGVTTYWLVEGLSHGNQVLLRWEEARNSVGISLGAALVSVVAAVPIALLSVRFKSKTTALIEKAAYVSYALPGIVVALSLVFFGARYGGPLYQTIWMLLFAYTILFLPQSIAAIRSSLLHVSPNVEYVARSLGYTSVQTWWSVTVPLIRPGLLSGGALVFLTAMKELPGALLLSPPGFRTLTTSLWGSVTEAFYARAAAPALILIALSCLSMWFILSDHNRADHQ